MYLYLLKINFLHQKVSEKKGLRLAHILQFFLFYSLQKFTKMQLFKNPF